MPHNIVSPIVGLRTDLTPCICHSVRLIVHLLSFIRSMYPAHFHSVLVTYWTTFVTLVPCLMVVLRIFSFSLTLSIFLSMGRWFLPSFFTNAFVRDHVWHPYVIAGKTHWLKTFLDSWEGGNLTSTYYHATLKPSDHSSVSRQSTHCNATLQLSGHWSAGYCILKWDPVVKVRLHDRPTVRRLKCVWPGDSRAAQSTGIGHTLTTLKSPL